MKLIETVQDLRVLRQSWSSETIAFVPTMGALHSGHLSLIERAKDVGSKVIVSIYVNPIQFGPGEDYLHYPRTREEDLSLCEQHGVDAVFYPNVQTLHPQGYEAITHVVPPLALVNQLCGLSRPGHFTGVATIVLKLFQLVQPHYAVFGEKDAQQLAVIRHMVRDLDLPIELIPAPTARESDGLAKSSRNVYLKSASDRQQARLLSRLLMTTQTLYNQGLETTEDLLRLSQEQVLDEDLYPDFELEYFAAVDSESFMPIEILDDKTRILVAAKVRTVRLIDNALISDPVLPTKPFAQAEHLTLSASFS
jgi:pantoate--beta-alanine ligase